MTITRDQKQNTLDLIADSVVYPQIVGKLSAAQLTEIETYFNELIVKGNFDDDELQQAIIGEITSRFDSSTVNALIANALDSTTFDIDLRTEKESLWDLVSKLCEDILSFTNNNERSFILASPIVISLMQATPAHLFSPAYERSFRGPNNIVLCGTLHDNERSVDVYSYLFFHATSLLLKLADSNVEIVAGYSNSELETTTKKYLGNIKT